LFHRDAIYLLDRFAVPLLGTIEPIPGVPPTASHLKELTNTLAGRSGVVLYPVYKSSRAPDTLAKRLGWPVFKLPMEPPLKADGAGYLKHLDLWVEAIAAAKP
jgi:zinc/manganese transport system substrate-binding protein